MHSYSINTNERITVSFYIATLSLILSVVIQWVLYKYNIVLPWFLNSFISIPTCGFFFWSFYKIFDKYLWNKKIFRKLGISSVPDLSGNWEGRYVSSHINKDGNNATGNVSLIIKQTWTKINITSNNGSSSNSYSEMAHIDKDSTEGIILKFQYKNYPNPNPHTPQSMVPHIGFSKLCFNIEKGILSGEYFSDRNRHTQGSAEYKRK